MCEDWGGLFLDGAIYRGSLFSGQNAKMGPGGARSHVGGWNLVQRHIFSMCEDWGGLFFGWQCHGMSKVCHVTPNKGHVTPKHVTWHPKKVTGHPKHVIWHPINVRWCPKHVKWHPINVKQCPKHVIWHPINISKPTQSILIEVGSLKADPCQSIKIVIAYQSQLVVTI